MSWIDNLLSRSRPFFLDFEELAETLVRGTQLLGALLDDFTMVPSKVGTMRDLEHLGDAIIYRAYQRLYRSFAPPFDRELIRRLLSRLDDTLDATDEAAQLLDIYEVKEVLQDARELAAVLVESAEHVRRAVAGLRHISAPGAILSACRQVSRCEKEADTILRRSVASLLQSRSDPLDMMKWKEILSLIEAATDRCDDVANALEAMVLEHA